MKQVLAIMARYPEVGSVKTRLARVVGDEEACRLYRAFLSDLGRRFGAGASVATPTASARWKTTWAITPAGARLDDVVGGCPSHIDQRGSTLGERMNAVFVDLFDSGAARVVMLGADIPHMPTATIEAALAALGKRDVVLVPSRDGGYCLVAMDDRHDIFSSVPMGTNSVLDDTTRLCSDLGLDVELLDPTFDIDEIGDVEVLDELLRHRADLPKTRAVLDDWHRAGWLTAAIP